MAILGPEITIAKVKSVNGIELDVNGEVININGDPHALLQALIDEFVELSGLIVKKTMESILNSSISSALNETPNIPQVPLTPAPVTSVPPSQPILQQPQQINMIQKATDSDITNANRDLEDLKKMLNNLSK